MPLRPRPEKFIDVGDDVRFEFDGDHRGTFKRLPDGRYQLYDATDVPCEMNGKPVIAKDRSEFQWVWTNAMGQSLLWSRDALIARRKGMH